jgi:hypothetical protein
MSGQVENKPRAGRRAAWILWLIAAALAFSAWAIDYFKDGRFRGTSMVLGLMCLILAVVSMRGSRR